MGENSKIEWTEATFNPWRGCTKVSDGCTNCYAETLSARNPKTLGVWGKFGHRSIAAESYWKMPFKLDKDAREGVCRKCSGIGLWSKDSPAPCPVCEGSGRVNPYILRVFCASLADVFEGDDTMPDASRQPVADARVRLARTIIATPNLYWQLVTKRPDNISNVYRQMLDGLSITEGAELEKAWLSRIWLIVSIEDQKTADERIPILLQTPAAVRGLSIEPLLGPVKLNGHDYPIAPGLQEGIDWLTGHTSQGSSIFGGDPYPWIGRGDGFTFPADSKEPRIHWVVVGGESGPDARPMHPDWARSIRDQCNAAGVPFFFKQWGEYIPDRLANPAQAVTVDGCRMSRVGKKKAGRILDGREWNEMPVK